MTNCWANSGFTACFEPADGDLSARQPAVPAEAGTTAQRAGLQSLIDEEEARLESLGFTGDNLLAEPHRPLTPETMRLLAELYANIAKHADQGEWYAICVTSDMKAVRGMLDAAADAATNALPKIDSAARGTLVDFNIEELLSGMNFSDGTLSIPKIASIKQDLSDAGVVLKRVKTSIYALPQPHTEQITEMVNQGKQVVDQIDEAFDTLNTIPQSASLTAQPQLKTV